MVQLSATYQGSSEVSFFLNDHDGLAVTIDTDRLHIRSVEPSEEDQMAYAGLFGDPEVMSKFGTGEVSTKDEIGSRVKDIWVNRWQQHNPYSALAVFKKDTDEFLGHVVLGHGDEAGQSELAYLFMKNHWGLGFGTEAVTAVVKEYAPATVEEGYMLEGKVLEKISATSRLDNLGSLKILRKLGMHQIGQEEKYGALRYQFSASLDELIKK